VRVLVLLICTGLAVLSLPSPSWAQTAKPKKLLVVTITDGFRHGPAIDAAERVLPKLAAESGGEFEFELLSEPSPRPNAGSAPKRGAQMSDLQWEEMQSAYNLAAAKAKAELPKWMAKVKELFALKLSSAALNNYDGVIFCNTTGDLPLPEGDALINWISQGKAFIGMHAATDTLKAMPSYFQMINGTFGGHPWGAGGTYTFVNHEPSHPTVAMFQREFQWKDEIYQYNHFNPAAVHVLISLDMAKSKPQAPYHVPVSWVRNVGTGRLFYTNLGHNAETWENEIFQKHIVAGIRWSLKMVDGPADPNPAISAQHSLKSLAAVAGGLLQKDAAALEKKAIAKAMENPQWASKVAAEADIYRTMPSTELLTRLVAEIEK
jgi:type 1 glutamine amidotransferase